MAGCGLRDHAYGPRMTTRTLALAAAFTLVLPASASAAKPGSYGGTSVNKEIYLYGDIEPRTDKGKVTFKVKSSGATVTKFKLKAQQFMCGATTAEILVSIAKLELNGKGKGKGTYSDPAVGEFEVKIKVGGNGKASGTITPTGLCSGKVTFTAKKK
jgi:hypothetical protein